MGSRGPISNDAKGLAVRRQSSRGMSAAMRRSGVPAASELPEPPAALGSAGRAAWRAALEAAPWLQAPIDLLLLEQWAQGHDERVLLLGLVERRGHVVGGSQGQPRTAPWIDQLRKLELSLGRQASALGLGPMARARIGKPIDRVVPIERPAVSIMEHYRRAARDERDDDT